MFLVSFPTHAACVLPQPPYIPDAAASLAIFAGAHLAVTTYVRDLDGYMSCVQNEATGLKPAEAKTAHDDYARGFLLMRQAIDTYNTRLAKHGASS